MMDKRRKTFRDRDEYNRIIVAENIVKFLHSEVDVFPMLLDGPWGCGKTEFCEKFQSYIEEEGVLPGYKCIYIDTFRADHLDDPIIMLLASLVNMSPHPEEFGKVARRVAGSFIKSAWRLCAGECEEKLVEGVKDLCQAIKNPVELAVYQAMQEYESSQQMIDQLKKCLSELVKEQKIIFLLDELDRCRPDFAIELLERMKHIFDVEGIKFMLVANSAQLHAIIKQRYGNTVDAKRYLDKFIKINISFPRTAKRGSRERKVSLLHLHAELAKHKETDYIIDQKYVREFLELLFDMQYRSLREIETYSRYIYIFQVVANDELRMVDDDSPAHIILCMMLIYCYCFEEKIMERMQASSIPSEKITALFLSNSYHKRLLGGGTVPANGMREQCFALFSLLSDSDKATSVFLTMCENLYRPYERERFETSLKKRWNDGIACLSLMRLSTAL